MKIELELNAKMADTLIGIMDYIVDDSTDRMIDCIGSDDEYSSEMANEVAVANMVRHIVAVAKRREELNAK